jgi:hypothetical protein
LIFKEDKSNISVSDSAGNSSFNQISSEAQIIQLLSIHLIFVFFIVIISSQCQETFAPIFATATFCHTSRFEPPQTI